MSETLLRVIFLALASALAASSGWPATADQPVRVMTFNIRYDNPNDGVNAWPHRRDWVGELIREHHVDVVGLQEALKSQIDDLQQRLPSYHWYGVGRDDGRQAGEYAPIFYNKDRFELLDKGHFWLCTKPDEPGRIDWDAACTRITTWIAVQEKAATGRPAALRRYFFNTHFDHQSGKAREMSAVLLRSRIAAINDGPVVLTGDFNCLSGSQPITSLTAKPIDSERSTLTDAYELAKDIHRGPLTTWNGFRAIRPDRRIDFVFVSPQWRVTGHRIVDDQRDGRFPSDHLPVVAELSTE